MEEARVFQEVSGHSFQVEERWAHRHQSTLTLMARVSGPSSGAMRQAPYPLHVEAGSVSTVCIPTVNSNLTTPSTSSNRRAMSLRAFGRKCVFDRMGCTSTARVMCG